MSWEIQDTPDLREFDFGHAGEVRPSDVVRWRAQLRGKLYQRRWGLSDVSGKPLTSGFDMHEGIFPRRYIPANVSWGWMLFHEYNSFLILSEEHIPEPPTRSECYWIAVSYYGKHAVDSWIDSLPWKVPPDRPWRGTNGTSVINSMLSKFHATDRKRSDFNYQAVNLHG